MQCTMMRRIEDAAHEGPQHGATHKHVQTHEMRGPGMSIAQHRWACARSSLNFSCDPRWTAESWHDPHKHRGQAQSTAQKSWSTRSFARSNDDLGGFLHNLRATDASEEDPMAKKGIGVLLKVGF